jgi:prephenate dehydratase/chorismate mutase
MELEEIRKKIDTIDQEMMRLLNERMELALRTKKRKQVIRDKGRESQVLDQVKAYSQSHKLLSSDFIEKFYIQLMQQSRKSQRAPRLLMGFQGEHGAFGDEAARAFDAHCAPMPCAEFAHVFAGVSSGDFDRGIVPVENSLGGAITQVNELLIESELKVVGAVKLRINHCLLVLPDTNYQEIQMAYSHPQALSQCREFLDRHRIEGRPFYDTAGAARWLIREKPKMAAVIASRLSSDLYGLEIIKQNIQNHPENYTRFLILAQPEFAVSGNKCSIIFSTLHKAGTLFTVLKTFADLGINLTRIESFPDRSDPGNYIFFLDFLFDPKQSPVEDILQTIEPKTRTLRFLGTYSEEVIQ